MEDFYFLKTLGQVMKAHFALSHCELEKEGLYPGQPQLLFVLYKKDGISQREISDTLDIKPATITVMIKRLEKSGFLYKKSDENDGRASKIFLSEKGKVACVKLKSIINRIDKICLENFTDKEIDILNKLLNKVKTNLDKHKLDKHKNEINDRSGMNC